MAGQKYNKAYEAYQQAVYRDGRNPTFWCSIGVLYFQINQFRDALDAYSRAIRINPYISEVWFDLGSLYESCNNQISDAIDAYARASELDPQNPVISQRLQLLRTAQTTGGQLPAAPGPQDVHPTAYASAVVPPPGLTGPPLMLQSSTNRPIFRTESRGPPNDSSLPLLPPPSLGAAGRNSPGPFRGGPPPPVILDESRHVPSHTPLAPMMDVDRYPAPSSRDGPSRGPSGHHSLLLHQPVHQQVPEDHRTPHTHHPEYLSRPMRAPSPSASPPLRARSPMFPSPRYAQQPSGPAQPSGAVSSQRSPRTYSHETSRAVHDHEAGWERRGPPAEHHREWEREHRPRPSNDYPAPPLPPPQTQQQHQQYHPSRSPPPPVHRDRGYSPAPSPHVAPPSRPNWESRAASGPSAQGRRSPPHHESNHRRYDPRYDARDERGQERPQERGYGSPEGARSVSHAGPPPRQVGSNVPEPDSSRPTPAPEAGGRRRKGAKDKEPETAALVTQGQEAPPKKERKKRTATKKPKEDVAVLGLAPMSVSKSTGPSKTTPEPSISNGSASSNRPSPPGPAPSRIVDDDYDEPGVAEALVGLSAYRGAPDAPQPHAHAAAAHSPTSGRGQIPSPRPSLSNRESLSSGASRSRQSSPSRTGSLKRPLSDGPDEGDHKRSRIDAIIGKPSSSGGNGRRTPVPSTRPSPIPFRTQPASRSPETHQAITSTQAPPHYLTTPPLPPVLPPHPKPYGMSSSQHKPTPISLPPIATLPSNMSPSPSGSGPDDRMQVDSVRHSVSPSSRSRHSDTASARPPPARTTPSPASSRHSHHSQGTAEAST